MTSSIHVASSSASIASTSAALQPQRRFDFRTRSCGLSPPMLFKRVGTVAANGQPLPTGFHAAQPECATRPERRRQPPGTGGEGRTARERTTAPHRLRTCRRAGSRDTDEGWQVVRRAQKSCEDDAESHRVRTCPCVSDVFNREAIEVPVPMPVPHCWM